MHKTISPASSGTGLSDGFHHSDAPRRLA